MKMKPLLRQVLLILSLAARFARAADGVTDTEVRIGSSLPLEGGFSAVGQQARRGMETCFLAVNGAGGVHGRQIKLIAYNDGYEPVPCVQNTQRLIDEDKVFALCTYVGTPTSVKAMRVWQARHIPVIGFYTGASALRTPFNPYNIHVRASYAQEASAIIDAFVQKAGARRIAIFYQNDAFGEAVKSVTEGALQRARLAPAAFGSFERNTLEVEKGLGEIKAANPEAIVMVGTYAPLAKFVKAAKAAGLRQTLFHTVSFVGPEAFAKDLGADAANVFVTQVMPPYQDTARPIVREFLAALTRAFPEAVPTFPSLEAYVNAKVLVEGLRRVGRELTQDGLVKAIETITAGEETIGLNVSYGPERHEGLTEVFITRITPAGYQLVPDWSAVRFAAAR